MSDIGSWRDEFFSLNSDNADNDEEKKKTFKLDLFNTVLPAIDRKDKYFYNKLTPEEQDSIEPWILMRWLTSTYDDLQPYALLSINDLVNINFSVLTPRKSMGIEGHKELQWMLLSLCGTGRKTQRKFMKPARGVVKNKLEIVLMELNPLMKYDDIELLQKINTKEDFEEYFRANAFDDATINELLKDF